VSFSWNPVLTAVRHPQRVFPFFSHAHKPLATTAKCLTAASNTEAAIITIQPCDGSPSQKWTFEGGVVKVFGDKCLDVPLGIDLDGTKLQILTCLPDSPNQKWFYTVRVYSYLIFCPWC
jgi:hypothetical protein